MHSYIVILATLVHIFIILLFYILHFRTVLSYWGSWAYFTISAIHTASYTFSYRKWKKAGQANEMQSVKQTEAGQLKEQKLIHSNQNKKPQSWLSGIFQRPLQFFHLLLVSTISTYPLLVTIVFWTILSGGAFETTKSTWQNLSVHAFNLLFTMADIIIFSRNPMLPWSHCFFCVLLLAMYVGVAYITYAGE